MYLYVKEKKANMIMKKNIKRIICGIIITILNIIFIALFVGARDLQQIIFTPTKIEYKTLDVVERIKDFSVDEYNNLHAMSSNPWILFELPQTLELSKIEITVASINQNDSSARIYYDEGEILGNKYVDFHLHSGVNEIYFPKNSKASSVRIDLTHIEDNVVCIDLVKIYFDKLIVKQFWMWLFVVFCVEILASFIFVKHSAIWKGLFANRSFRLMLFCTTIVFLALYCKYIMGENLYAFTDVGSDTYYGYLPQYIAMINKIKDVDFSFYNLQDGIGNSWMANANVHMELPFILILYLFGEAHIYQGILFCVFLKIIIIEIFCYLFIIENKIDEKIAAIISIFWGFSGYIVLWGQHGFVLTAMIFFTLFMLIIEKILNGNKKWWFVFPLIIGIYSVNNFYFLYSCLATSGVYFFVKLLRRKEKCRYIIGNVCLFFCFALLGIMMFLPLSAEWLICMMESARTADEAIDGVIVFNIRKVCTLIGRMISTDCFGVTAYMGLSNLYEDPILATSILIIPAAYWFCKKKVNNIFLLCMVMVSCFLPFVSRLFIMLTSNRWYYFYSFLSLVIIAHMLNDILIAGKSFTTKDILVCLTIISMISSILVYGHLEGGMNYNIYSLGVKAVVLILYLFILKSNHGNSKYICCLVIAMFELYIGNYNIVNERDTIKQEEYELFVQGDTHTLIDEIQSVDTASLYRIRDYVHRSYLSHSAIEQYMGTNSYSSLNKKYAIDFIDSLQETDSAHAISQHGNHLDIACENYAIQTLLGVKYIITDSDTLPPIGYSLWKTLNGTNAYYNNRYLGLGIVYDKVISKENYNQLSPLQKYLMLYDAYYVDECDGDVFPQSSFDDINVITSYDYDENGIWGECSNDSKSILVEKKSLSRASEMVIDMTSPATGKFMKIYYAESGEDFCEEKVLYRYLIQGRRKYSIYIDAQNVEKIKIIPIHSDTLENNSFTIHDISVVAWNRDYQQEYVDKAEMLKEKCVVNSSFSHDKYIAFFENNVEGALLFIPIGYSVNWSATVNGKKVDVQRVDDAFCGIYLPQGECSIVMTYQTIGVNVWIMISIVSMLVWIGAYIYCVKRNRVQTIKYIKYIIE